MSKETTNLEYPSPQQQVRGLQYRPNEYDDWGMIRNADGSLFAVVRRPAGEDELAEHRRHGTDPYEDLARRLMSTFEPTPERHVGWTKAPDQPPLELLKSINVDNQVLAYENGRYYNAWFTFEPSEGGWLWTDDADSEPNPSHYRLLSEVALALEGKNG